MKMKDSHYYNPGHISSIDAVPAANAPKTSALDHEIFQLQHCCERAESINIRLRKLLERLFNSAENMPKNPAERGGLSSTPDVTLQEVRHRLTAAQDETFALLSAIDQ
jgi:hypothetical protein